MIIGDKSSFAIEIDMESATENLYKKKVLAPLRIWVKNHPIGTLQDHTYLPVFLGQLEYHMNDLYGYFGSYYDKEELFDKIMARDDSYCKYRLSPGDSFDDYVIYLFYIDYDLYILWKIHDEPFFLYEQNELNRVFLCQINKSEIMSVIQNTRDLL